MITHTYIINLDMHGRSVDYYVNRTKNNTLPKYLTECDSPDDVLYFVKQSIKHNCAPDKYVVYLDRPHFGSIPVFYSRLFKGLEDLKISNVEIHVSSKYPKHHYEANIPFNIIERNHNNGWVLVDDSDWHSKFKL